MRTGRLQEEQTTMTFESAMRLSCSAIPPLTRGGLAFTCLRTIMTCSTRSLLASGNTRRTRPCLPLSLPAMTLTVSLRRISIFLRSVIVSVFAIALPLLVQLPLKNFRRQGHNFQKLLIAQLARYGTENARPDRLACVVDEHGSVAVETNVGAIAAALLFPGANDDCLHHRALLGRAIGCGFLDAGRNHVAQRGVRTHIAAEWQNHLQLAGAGVIGHLQHAAHHHGHKINLLKLSQSTAAAAAPPPTALRRQRSHF